MMATLVQWDPVAQVERLQRELDRMFMRVDTGIGRGPQTFGAWLPETDVEQTEDAVVFKLDLPGVTADEVKVGVHDHLLAVTGERREDHEVKHEGFLSRERATGRFERSMRLPENVKDEDIKASFRDGVLTITVPRVAESTPRQITIATS